MVLSLLTFFRSKMTYQETINYLYAAAPLFQNIGAGAYKEGLSTTKALDEYFGHPHRNFKTIHVGGTNGKGSTSHSIASVLQTAGYKVGLFTSPHLVDFRERIRVNGEMMEEKYVVDFVANHRHFFEPLYPSFFELTTALAFKYFADQKVDIAVVEVGLGGKLDCTNIISPLLSIITNISFDHTQFLGNSLTDIAREKAGIIKPHTPVVIGEHGEESDLVFIERAKQLNAPLYFAEDEDINTEKIDFQLKGDCQIKNLRTICTALRELQKQLNISTEHIREGLAHVCDITHLMGRWQTLSKNPLTICDTGHNIGGWEYLAPRLQKFIDEGRQLHIVFGMVNDKDITHVVALLPKQAHYYFTQATVNRALPAEKLSEIATNFNLKGSTFANVKEAHQAALNNASPEDVIFIGGSTFVVADLLS
jgi:dihydrofolate synthase/folylpolyglutamate synthase